MQDPVAVIKSHNAHRNGQVDQISLRRDATCHSNQVRAPRDNTHREYAASEAITSYSYCVIFVSSSIVGASHVPPAHS